MRVATVLTPLARRSSAYRALTRISPVILPADYSLHRVLDTLTRGGTSYPLRVRVEGREVVDEAIARGRGVLIASPHAPLCVPVLAWLDDRAFPIEAVAASDFAWVSGSDARRVPTLARGPGMMIRVRTRLREGRTVWAMIDRTDPRERRLVRFDTHRGPFMVSDALVKVAVRCGAEVVFLSARADPEHGICASFAAPRPGSAGSVEHITADFADFVRDSIRNTAPAKAAATSPSLALAPSPAEL
jgi:lauroyl/myristoyl acyltransferase